MSPLDLPAAEEAFTARPVPRDPLDVIEGVCTTEDGYFVATYVTRGERGWLGYAKVCRERPHDVWFCRPLRKVAGPCRASPVQAFLGAQERGRQLAADVARFTAGGARSPRSRP